MTIRHMMYYLLDGPASIAVRGLQLGLIQVDNGVLQQLGQELDIVEPFFFLLLGKWPGFIFPDRVTQVGKSDIHKLLIFWS
jgi:hypothetical protein